MHILRTVEQWQPVQSEVARSGQSLGFVPTMGYLHEGHLSLVREARKANDRVAVSIFVNPTQFGPQEDLDKYPRDEARDLALLRQEGVDCVFIPSAEEMYPAGFSTFIEPPSPSQGWCGASRPTHFRGVCTVVAMLFNIIRPRRAYFGQKDAQQAAVIRRMVKDLHFPLEIVVCPIVREGDGLALSSRNVYLSAEDRERALILSRTLSLGLQRFGEGTTNAEAILDEGRQRLGPDSGVRLDYLGIVNPNTMQSVRTVRPGDLYLGAVFIGSTRLIDNMIFAASPARSVKADSFVPGEL